jgi:hypothetical protein
VCAGAGGQRDVVVGEVRVVPVVAVRVVLVLVGVRVVRGRGGEGLALERGERFGGGFGLGGFAAAEGDEEAFEGLGDGDGGAAFERGEGGGDALRGVVVVGVGEDGVVVGIFGRVCGKRSVNEDRICTRRREEKYV